MHENRLADGPEPGRPLEQARRVTLSQLLAAVAILGLLLAFYAPVWRERRTVPAMGMVAVFCAHAVELEAFLFLVISPAVRWCFSRGRVGASGALDEGGGRNDVGRVFLVAGPWLAVLFPIACWADGYRLAGFTSLEPFVFLLVLGVAVTIACAGIFAIIEIFNRRATAIQYVGAAGLLILALPCFFCYGPAYDAGLRRVEREIGVSRLAHECLVVFESKKNMGTSRLYGAGN